MQKLILGTVQLGMSYGINNLSGQPSPEQSWEILSLAHSSDIDTLDTAEGYGNAIDVIGGYHKQHAPFRIISKFSSPENLAGNCLSALQRLNITSFEAYLFHSYPVFQQTKNTTLPVLDRLKQEGKIKKIGVSIYTNEEMETAIGTPEIDLIQLPFNLFDNMNKRGELMERAHKAGKEIHTRSVFLQGLFFMNENSIPVKLKPLLTYLQKIKHIALSNKISVQLLALNYVLQCPLIDKVLIGVDSVEQLKENLEMASYKVDPLIFEEVNTIKVTETELLNPVNWK